MKMSPLQLKDHRFTRVAVKVIEGGDSSAVPSFEPTIWFEPVPETVNQWKLALAVKLASADSTKPFSYEAEIQVQGLVQTDDGFPEERREQLAVVNGLSILYSAVREMLLNITARSASGAVTLPTLSFVEMVTEARKQKTEAGQRPSPVPTKPA
jgi:preprotein translocase subunit SecB